MITANDLRTGRTFEMDGELWVCLEYHHVKPGKGSAIVRLKIKNVDSGAIIERTFRPEEKFKPAFLDHRRMQYLYSQGDTFFFMDTDSYEQLEISREDLGSAVNFMIENEMIEISFYKGRQIGVELPNFVILTVVETDPGFKGDRAQAGTKPAIANTGYKLQVPLFIEMGEDIKVDTRTGLYLERANK
ncbi:MAG TPA: elongation factor P [Caldisericia bacterium]|nr:elongation factor P [Caldisericia bacterium]HPF49321.1 elongation factor P [Caldisericia bacterium]HPI83999.1 elongation factor P [Caldisericia bacterium]HPQ93257.1 elongation factor P [Caldisericia bacterium]HRV75361.1 elongation factor P [Caldisericia bacterium]